jgi:hypothetical protein
MRFGSADVLRGKFVQDLGQYKKIQIRIETETAA